MDTQKFAEILYGTVLPSGIDLTEQAKIVSPLFTFSSSIVPPSLFRYRRCNERNIDAFYKNQCWVSLARNMNDGFDGRLYYDQKALYAWRDKLTAASNSMELKDFFLSGNGFPQSITERFPGIYELYLLISSTPEPQVCEMINDYRKFIIDDIASINTILATSIQNTIKFCCLSEKNDSPAMWGLYADDETGFALEYNFSSRPESVQHQEHSNMCTCFPVIYSDNRYIVSTEYIKFLLIRRWLATTMQKSGYIYKYPAEAYLVQSAIPCPDIFVATKVALHKSREWEHEREWRVFCSITDNPDFANAEHAYFLKEATALYLGRRISSIYEKILKDIAKEKNIPVYKMKLNDELPTYKLTYELTQSAGDRDAYAQSTIF